MALPSFLQAMFTPTGPPRQRMDQGGGEYTGFIPGVYEGDDSSPINFQRAMTSRSVSGPTTRRIPERLPDPLPGTGEGPDRLTQISRDLEEEMGIGGGGAGSALPSGTSTIAEIMQSFGGPTQDELGIGGGSGSSLGAGLADMETMSAFDAPMTTLATAVQDLFTPQSSGDPNLQGAQVDTSVTSPLFQDPMGSGIGGVRASDQRFTPPMAEDPGVLESIKDKIVGMPAFHLNVADQVGTGGSRSQFKQDRANTLADELAFGASADSRNMRKQPPGFWDFATGGLLKGPSQYMPSAWNIDIPGQVNPGIEAQISEHAQQRKILEDRESMLRAKGMPEFKIQQAMGQHYTGPMTEGTL